MQRLNHVSRKNANSIHVSQKHTNTIITKMYLAILKCTTVDIAAHGHILTISDSLIASMSRSFVDWVLCMYSGTPLIRTPRGHAKVSILSRCPYWLSDKKSRTHILSIQRLCRQCRRQLGHARGHQAIKMTIWIKYANATFVKTKERIQKTY